MKDGRRLQVDLPLPLDMPTPSYNIYRCNRIRGYTDISRRKNRVKKRDILKGRVWKTSDKGNTTLNGRNKQSLLH